MIELLVGPLVRAVSAESVVIWAEFSDPCWVTVQADMDYTPNVNGTGTHAVTAHTITVGGRHYAAPHLSGLPSATWYTYQVLVHSQKGDIPQPTIEHTPKDTIPQLFCFRTLDPFAENYEAANPLRIAYGSCRKSGESEHDALSTFGEWLLQHREQREEQWPRLLLLIGDQIYADQPPTILKDSYPSLREGAQSFADFATLYAYVWTQDKGVRQALAVLPTFMIFDDHEIDNNWNVTPQWRPEMIRQGHELLLIDGLVAYWVYQGWGNSGRDARQPHSPLLAIMQRAEQSGEDALEELRACLRQEVYDEVELHWHYTIPTYPPIFVLNARADRSAVFTNDEQAVYAPGRIMGHEQMRSIRTWVKEQNAQKTGLSILVSSVPVLLPPLIGLGESIMSVRLWQRGPVVLRKLGLRLAHLQMRLALKTSFDHWPIFAATWQEMMQIVDESQQDFLLLSGDVHFSYAIEGHRPGRRKPRLQQLVCTPLQNKLNKRDRQIIVQQSYIKRLFYGGLLTRILPLQDAHEQGRIHHDLLLQNTLAVVTIELKGQQHYQVEQVYMGVFDGQMAPIAKTIIPS